MKVKQTEFAALNQVLTEFNAINENSENTGDFTSSDKDKQKKIKKLKEWLKDKEYKNSDGTDIDFPDYDEKTAGENRTQNFREWDNKTQAWVPLKQSDYSAAILPAG